MIGKKGSDALVSVVIPSYNHSRYISDSITSVLTQTYANLELIIVDDGSTDNSLEIIHSFSDDRITVYQQDNSGAHNAINRAFQHTNGQYVAILNSDDEYQKNRIKKCIERFRKDDNTGLISTWLEVMDARGKKLAIKKGWENLEPWNLGDRHKSFFKTASYELNLLASNFVSTTSNMIFRRSVYELVGGMRALKFAHDWDFMLRVASRFQCDLLKQPLVRYRLHDSNTIRSDRAAMMFEICFVAAANMAGYFGRHLFRNPDFVADADDLEMLYESLNFQGNDKLVWLIYTYMESLRMRGISDPVERILGDESVRKFFVSKVVDQ